ncbi:uncharacterized protein GIQ15_04948 [Arthroderma uncinatum]|uniref:uncharacterized protein n=1 Tax=Arthroderma uncinatum TaxID=74035 RepID=UPI00144AC2C0|nr:uncharacterized protein GIQ15_04948 [Arthroderma uncinatum]KAF3482189.1 hypothetical protein GIQ15_04948 [Arthroderma uncinatum]
MSTLVSRPKDRPTEVVADDGDKLASQQEGVLDRVFQLTPTPSVILDPSFRIVEVSKSYLDFFHLAREDCINSSITCMDSSKIPLSDGKLLREAIDRAVSIRAINTVDEQQTSPATCRSSFRIVPVFEHDDSLAYVLVERCSKKERTVDDVVREQLDAPDTYRSLVDSVQGIAIFMLNTKGCVETWNNGARMLKGYRASEIIGKHFSIFYSQEDQAKNKPGKELQKCLQEGRLEDEGWRHRKDGSRFWANVVIAPVFHHGTHIGFSKVTRDITERKSIEARIISAYEGASHLKSNFLATMSHEIRTPLNGLCSASALLRDTRLTDEQNNYAQIIADSSSVLLQIMNDILDYSKIASGSFSINTDIIQVRESVDTCIRHFQDVAKPGVLIHTSFSPDIPERLKGDPVRFRQILQNLVGNAVKFTECGSVTVKVTVPHRDNATHCIRTEIVDTGIGISADSAKLLFEPFTQVRQLGGKQYQGTGLGLAICRSLVEMMGGTISYEPNHDIEGSIFRFTLNLREVELPQEVHRESTPPGMTPLEEIKSISPAKQLLLVEDNNINQAVILKVLNALGFKRIDAACDGEQAVSILKQKPFSYDVVLMDINMPVMDGVTATGHIRNTLGLDVPIVALTANALKGDAESFLSKGMNGYVPKPVDRGRLIEVLLSILV